MADKDCNTPNSIVVAGVEILQDEHGRYNLNLLHRASDADDHKKPSEWLSNKNTQALVSELNKQQSGNSHSGLEVRNGGANPGTYAHELLVVSYAGWISPAFQLKVNQAFLDSRRPRFQLPDFTNPAEAARAWALEYERAEAERLEKEKAHAQLEAQAVQIEAERPMVEFHREVSRSTSQLHISDVVKLITHYRPGAEKELVAWMQEHGWLEKQVMGRVASRWACRQGYMRNIVEVVNGRTCHVAVVLGKGLTTLRHLYRTGDLFTGDIDPARLLAAPAREV